MSCQVQTGEHKGLRIQLLGGFCVWAERRAVAADAWKSRKAAAVVKLLALAPGHRLHREQVMDLLWPGFEPRAADNNLRRTLYTARRILSPSAESRLFYLQGNPLALLLGGSVWVDVEAFEAAAASARRTQDATDYRAALGLYTGDLLPEDRYEEWAAGRREGLRQTYLSLLIDLAQAYEAQGELGPAIESFRQAVACEPAHEDAHLGLMRLYARSGQRYRALQQYRRLRETLQREVDAAPTPAAQRVYQDLLNYRYSTPGAAAAPTPPPAIRRHNLPEPVTRFIGREREISEVIRLFGQARLLTLTGPGGCGKTRLAQEVAARLVADHPDGAWLVELAALADPELVPKAVASAMGIPERPGRSLTEMLSNAFETKHLLLVLDNCEHLVDACAALAHALLSACPQVRILATSRQALGIAGEQVWRVPSLDLPDARRLSSLDEVSSAEAVRLFVDRARLGRPGFALTDDNAPAVAEVCQRLDGMPLAIELAASRLRTLSVEQIAALLGNRFRLLTGGNRVALPRQRTLRATVDWSYDLLSEAERALFDRLSVFAGGWTLEAAEAVCVGPDLPPERVLDLLTSLADQSLVSTEADERGAMRYRLLETLRQYGQERLAERVEAVAVRRRHAAYCLALAEAGGLKLTGPQQVAWLDRVETEHDNLRMALGWSLKGGDLTAARLCSALGYFWYVRGHTSEGVMWIDATSSTESVLPEPVRAKLLTWAGALRLEQGDYARAWVELEESLALWQRLGDRYWTAVALNALGVILSAQRDVERAATLHQTALAAARDVGDKGLIGLSLDHLGDLARQQQDYGRAASLYEQGLDLFRETGDLRRIAFSLTRLANVAMQQGGLERALAFNREALELACQMRDMRRIAVSLEGLADVACAQGQLARGARLLGAADALRETIGAPPSLAQRAVYERYRDVVRADLDEAPCAAAWAEGRAMTAGAWDQAIEYALAEEPSTPLADTVPEGRTTAEQLSPLTPRETQVALLLARGLTNREIATELVIAEGTAANHVRHIMTKLGVHSRRQIAAWVADRYL